MAVVVEAWIGGGWTAVEDYIPFHGDTAQGIIPFELETVRESNIGVLRFGMDSSAVNPAPGQEIRVVVDGTTRFGGYITSREQSRHGAATSQRTIPQARIQAHPAARRSRRRPLVSRSSSMNRIGVVLTSFAQERGGRSPRPLCER